jgi:putative acetyltransferase
MGRCGRFIHGSQLIAMNLRAEKPADREAVHALHVASFPTDLEARLVDMLRDAGKLTISLVAEEEELILGHVGFSAVTAPGVTGGVGLAPVAVLPGFRRRGIAAELIRQGLAACSEMKYGFVVVLGEPDYYKRFGFKPAATWGLQDEYGGGQAFQALELRAGAIPSGTRIVQYAPEFAMVEERH